MCDFSEYGGANDQLLALLSTLPKQPDLPVPDLKRTTNQWREETSQQEMLSLAPQVLQQNHSIPTRDGSTIPARSYRPASLPATQSLPIYMHFHGGGFLFGTLDSEDATCARIALATEVVVLNVCYRHTPAHVFPTQWRDTEDAYDWTLQHGQRAFHGDARAVVVGGISAGGTLAASLALTKKRQGGEAFAALKGQVLMIPCLAHEQTYAPALAAQMKGGSVSSYVENEFAPVLGMARVRLFNSLLFPSLPAEDDRRINIAAATPEEVRGLPPATVGVAGLDPLRDEALIYARTLARGGVPTDVHLFKGVPHGYRRFGEKLDLSATWDEVMHEGIRWALRGPKASGKVKVNVHV